MSTPENFYVENRDNSCLDTATDVSYLRRKLPHLDSQFQHIRSLQDRMWDLRKVTSHGPIIGDPNFRCVAIIPKDVGLAAEALEPELFRSESVFYSWLRRNPEYSTTRAR